MTSAPQNQIENVNITELLKKVKEDLENALLIAGPVWDECCRLMIG